MNYKKVRKIANTFGWKMVAEVIETLKKAKEFEKQMQKVKEITKNNDHEFIGVEWEIDRKNDKRGVGILKSENITITIKMLSSGNTSSMSKQGLLDYIMNNWNTIKYDENNIR